MSPFGSSASASTPASPAVGSSTLPCGPKPSSGWPRADIAAAQFLVQQPLGLVSPARMIRPDGSWTTALTSPLNASVVQPRLPNDRSNCPEEVTSPTTHRPPYVPATMAPPPVLG